MQITNRYAAYLVALAILISVISTCANAQSPKRLALVIGNDNYTQVPVLANARNDARAMAKEFKDAGFDVTVALDQNHVSALTTVASFTKRIAAGDDVAIFFAGHGVQLKTGNYLLPTDVPDTSENVVRGSSLALDDLMDQLKEAAPKFTLIVIDACRDNPFKVAGSATTRAIGEARGLRPPEPPRGQLVVFSASRGQKALDKLNASDTDPNGVFTREFIKKMRQKGVSVEQVAREVQASVERLAADAGREQVPAIFNESRGNFYFFVGDGGRINVTLPNPPSAPAPAPATARPPTPDSTPNAPAAQSFKDCSDCPEMVMLPAGNFMMGYAESDRELFVADGGTNASFDRAMPRHRVAIAYSFAVGKFEVTFAEWDACVSAGGCKHTPDDKGWGRGNMPVMNVSWHHINQQYLPWLSAKAGKKYRLLTEAEWEYAARAGTTTVFATGDKITLKQAMFNGRNTHGEVSKAARVGQAIPVGSLNVPNNFGLHDMHGNVWEWVQDCESDNYQGVPANGAAYVGNDCVKRGQRGGSMVNDALSLRSSARMSNMSHSANPTLGFRVARAQ
jgi:formylglycine-generating enzyme required for sulfatase activity